MFSLISFQITEEASTLISNHNAIAICGDQFVFYTCIDLSIKDIVYTDTFTEDFFRILLPKTSIVYLRAIYEIQKYKIFLRIYVINIFLFTCASEFGHFKVLNFGVWL